MPPFPFSAKTGLTHGTHRDPISPARMEDVGDTCKYCGWAHWSKYHPGSSLRIFCASRRLGSLGWGGYESTLTVGEGLVSEDGLKHGQSEPEHEFEVFSVELLHSAELAELPATKA